MARDPYRRNRQGPAPITTSLSKGRIVTTILAPTTQASTADQTIETLATYVVKHGNDVGGEHQRAMLLAAVLRRLFDVTAEHAIHLAKRDAFDPRVKAAGQACEEILDRVRRAHLAAQSSDWTPQPGDTVTWNDHDGVWTVTGYEDDDTVWLRLQRDPAAPTTPAGTFADYLTSTSADVHFGPLVAIADLRPFEAAAEVTV